MLQAHPDMATMNMAGMNPAVMAPGGPVGGGMILMNNGSPATQANLGRGSDDIKQSLNNYIYEYFIKLGYYDIARTLLREEKLQLRTVPKASPSRRKDAEVNGVDGDSMDTDIKDDIPDDLPRPQHFEQSPGAGFLFEWFSIFSDLFAAHRFGKMQGGQPGMGTAAQYLMQHQNMQRMRENQQNQNLGRPGMMATNRFMQQNLRNTMVNGNIPRDMANKMTPQQLQQFKQAQMLQAQQQQQMQREQGDVDMNGRASSPAEGENGGSPSKRPRLEGQQFNGGMMPNARPGMPNVPPQNMMIQNAFNPNMTNPQFRQNGGMPQKPMQQAGMANGMMNMANAGSPMMQGMNPQFDNNMQMDMYNQRMAGQQLQGAPGGGQSGNHALQDYQMQLMLLEQQNKKRLMMARQEQDNAVNRDGGPGAPMVGMQPGMSPGSRTGTSPNPVDQMKRTPQLGGLPGSPSAGDMARGSPAAGMNFMNGMPGGGDFNPQMFLKDNPGMVPGGPGMRPPTSMEIQQNMARAQQQNRMAGQFQGGQPMVQNPSQGQPQPMGTPGQRNEMPPPQAPATGNGPRNQGGSPQSGNAPPTPSTTNKPNPKGKKAKEDTNKKRPAKKNSTANAPPPEAEPPATPTPSTPITPVHAQGFNNSAGKGGAMPNQAPPPNAVMPPAQPQMHQPDLSQPNFGEFNDAGNFNLDFSSLENSDVLENFDFDSFLNTSTEGPFDFDNPMGVGGDFGLDTNE